MPMNGKTGAPLALAMQQLLPGGTITPAGSRLVVKHTFASAATRLVNLARAYGLANRCMALVAVVKRAGDRADGTAAVRRITTALLMAARTPSKSQPDAAGSPCPILAHARNHGFRDELRR